MTLSLPSEMMTRSISIDNTIDKSTTSYGSYLADLYRSQESSIVILVDADTPPLILWYTQYDTSFSSSTTANSEMRSDANASSVSSWFHNISK